MATQKSGTLEVLNPVSQLEAELMGGIAVPPRPRSLEGKRVGLYWNMKPGGIYFLNRLETLLKQRIPGVQVSHFKIRSPVRKEVVESMAAQCDVVVCAQAD